ncbi:MAG: 1,4-dihydroxy-2-naphthoate polyprenyltransferase [Promicromonosporaceae bacterium]|nr:1,4-dihydroxy-2-naphthoate polyprenyltransferase [Promicromonosporaceae bacterium]
MATRTEWIAGARPRTLPAAVAPVLIGSAAAGQIDLFNPGRAALALGVALALQVGANYANDYSDGVRGTDLNRVGPLRLTASGLARPAHVRAAALAAFGVAAALGLWLVVLTGHWWLLTVGAACIGGAWYYTGGRRPYGYAGLGEVGVFVFFGLVATLGTTFTQAGRLTWAAGLGATGVGLIACGLLVVNNLRDLPTDTAAGKRTLAVRLGDSRTRRLYLACIWLPLLFGAIIATQTPWALLTLLLLGPAALLSLPVAARATGRALVPVLSGTGLYELAFGVLLSIGLTL